MYKTLRSVTKHRNPNPITFGHGFAYQTSEQAQTYLLCEECEDRLRQGGENWVLANCYRTGGMFRLRETLEHAAPMWADSDIQIYSAARIPAIDTAAMAYFSLSVFWRAAVHPWRVGSRRIDIDLGPYREPFRRFLMNEASFPACAALSVLVGIESQMVEWAANLRSGNDNGFHSHRFTIPGITFMLSVGARVPAEYLTVSFAPTPEHFIAVYPAAEQRQLMEIYTAFRAAPLSARL